MCHGKFGSHLLSRSHRAFNNSRYHVIGMPQVLTVGAESLVAGRRVYAPALRLFFAAALRHAWHLPEAGTSRSSG
jgi:hypothetical protein